MTDRHATHGGGEPPHSTGVILAAGAGSRLGVLTRHHSKAMLPLAGRPLIAWVVERLATAGVGRCVVVGHPTDHALANWTRERDIALVVQDERRGIAEAIGCALPLLGDESGYLATACDSLFAPSDIKALVALGRTRPPVAVVGVLDMGSAATAARSAVRLAGERVVEVVEKPDPNMVTSGLVAAPLYWLPRQLDALLAAARPHAGERHVTTALNDYIRSGHEVMAVHLTERLEITTADDLRMVAQRLSH